MRAVVAIALLSAHLAASAMTYYLTDQWVKGGSRFCEYSNGTVLNVGASICPLSIRG